jgi:phage repressor protein C with HTH and peptisase S24 domain
MSQTELARLARLTQPTISGLESGASNTSGSLASIAAVLGVRALWLETGLGERDISPENTPATIDSSLQYVPLLECKGSCGNGRLGFDNPDYTPIAISAHELERLRVKAKNLVALYADGDSMANYIMHGDVLFFDTACYELQDGSIYLLDTPDGLRVKRVSRRADGRVALRSDNADKVRFPDEDYSAEQASQLTIKGRLVLRMGV